MKNTKKTIKLLSELMGFCFDAGLTNIHIDVEQSELEAVITLKGKTLKITQEQIDEARELLDTPREPQVEEYYWELIGETEHGEELSLVGMMIDKVEIYYEDGLFEIKVSRRE